LSFDPPRAHTRTGCCLTAAGIAPDAFDSRPDLVQGMLAAVAQVAGVPESQVQRVRFPGWHSSNKVMLKALNPAYQSKQGAAAAAATAAAGSGTAAGTASPANMTAVPHQQTEAATATTSAAATAAAAAAAAVVSGTPAASSGAAATAAGLRRSRALQQENPLPAEAALAARQPTPNVNGSEIQTQQQQQQQEGRAACSASMFAVKPVLQEVQDMEPRAAMAASADELPKAILTFQIKTSKSTSWAAPLAVRAAAGLGCLVWPRLLMPPWPFTACCCVQSSSCRAR